jgi:hypothetical protein
MAYMIYIPGQIHVVVIRDVRFEEDLDFKRSLEIIIGGEEKEAPKVEESTIPLCTKELLVVELDYLPDLEVFYF